MSIPKVFFILGGPGAGKGTICARLVEEFGYTHFCAGELLRDAAKEKDSDTARKIAHILEEGNIVPSEITVSLIREKMAATPNPRGYLLDGFPRKMDQSAMFEEGIAKAKGVFFFNCTLETMEKRLQARIEAGSSRSDDNLEAMRRRFRVNEETCVPVVQSFVKENRCYEIDANKDREEVYQQVVSVLRSLNETPLEPSQKSS